MTDRKKPNPLILIAVVGGLWYLHGHPEAIEQLKQSLGGLGGPAKPDTPPEPPPSAEMQALVQPIKALLDTAKADTLDRQRIADFYRDGAEALSRDTAKVTVTGQFREAHKAASALMFARTNLTGKYAGLPVAISKAIEGAIGLDNAPLDAAKRARLVEVLKAIAWGCEGA